jgi:hypothetical protein
MADYPYTSVTGRLRDLLTKVQSRSVTVPAAVTPQWLEGLGYNPKSGSSLLGVLRALGFVDAAGNRTPLCQEYRTADHGKVMARAIRRAYAGLHEQHPEAQRLPGSSLEAFFAGAKPKAARKTLRYMVRTYRALCGLADFSDPWPEDWAGATGVGLASVGAVHAHAPERRGPSVNINIELHIPENADPQTYDMLFSALRKHLLSGGGD